MVVYCKSYLEAREVGDVEEGNLFDFHPEFTLVGDATEGSLAASLKFSYLQLAAIPLLLVHLSLMKGDGMRVLVPVVLCEFVRIQPVPLFVLGSEIHLLELCEHGCSL